MRWKAHMARQPQLHRGAPASWFAGDRIGRGRREEGEYDGSDVQTIKTAGAWVKKGLKLNLPKVKSKTFEYHFCSNFQGKYFYFMTLSI
jgi:hypothetical protein